MLLGARLIDSHIHVSNPHLPGIKILPELLLKAPEEVASQLHAEMQHAGICVALAIGTLNISEIDPLGIGETSTIAKIVPGIHPIGVMDATRTAPEHLDRVERLLRQGNVKALKGFLGYQHFGPEHPGFQPYYRLAEKYDLPVLFHSGDTYSKTAKLKYAHPLRIDEVAVDHPNVRFVIAHTGNPWLIDAAQVIYKNDNVWADLSGILVGDEAYFDRLTRSGSINRDIDGIVAAIDYSERPDRFLYGSDWPFAPMKTYLHFIERAIPVEHREDILQNNARRLFKL